ncbi:MAG: glycine zipper family protein [Deltaproteobacteria bacterium]|nr:glycine zipper family protein [Deltaproteobacteria bacterium]
MNSNKIIFVLLVLLFGLFSCTSYKSRYTGFRPAAEYGNSVNVAGLTIGAEAFADQAAAREAFGFDIKKAGLLPVQMVMDNRDGNVFELETKQTFLVDNNNRYWNLIPNYVAVERVTKATQSGAILAGAGKGAGWGAASGAVLGAAFGILTGENVLEAAGRGAAVGAAGGAVYGGAQGGTDPARKRTIAEDIHEKGLEGKVIPSQSLVNGFLFFPAEAQSARELRLQIRNVQSGTIYSVYLPFGASTY